MARKIWAPIGETPVRYASERHDRLSAMCALTVAPWAQRFGLYYELLDHNCRTIDVKRFICSVHQHLRRSMILICDRWRVHRSAANQLTQEGCLWFRPEWLPAYAPELDPVEFVWNQSKYGDLANWAPGDINDLRTHLVPLFEQYRHDRDRLYSFFRIADLPI